jgi:hypothetical protein
VLAVLGDNTGAAARQNTIGRAARILGMRLVHHNNEFAIMAKAPTVLIPVQQGELWRVQIIWPNGAVHYFGNYGSRGDALNWIAEHAWLIKRVDNKSKSGSQNQPPATDTASD